MSDAGKETEPVTPQEAWREGPCCPKCGRVLAYSYSPHIGGRGPCWRYECINTDNGSCDYIEKWKSS